jgi:hypothetical protein
MVGKEYLGMNVDKRGYIHTLPTAGLFTCLGRLVDLFFGGIESD